MNKNLALHIDYTVLKPGTTLLQVQALCNIAIQNHYKAVCIPPSYIKAAKEYFETAEHIPLICTVVGFPHGMQTTTIKLAEVEDYARLGAQELDMVSNSTFVKNQDWDSWLDEVKRFSDACSQHGVTSKLIIETSMLDEDELAKICALVQETKLDYVKTSTGFVGAGAQLDIVKRMRALLPGSFKIKASGGIRDAETASAFIEAGVDRIGTSTAL
ncbi:MAG: deoxyribose-phosphate aldolase [Bacteroidia bacterium]